MTLLIAWLLLQIPIGILCRQGHALGAEFMSNRPRSGDFDTQPVAIRAITPREYVNRYFPPGSLLAEPISPPFEGSKFAQACRDVLALFSALLLIFATGFGIAFSLFALFFLRF